MTWRPMTEQQLRFGLSDQKWWIFRMGPGEWVAHPPYLHPYKRRDKFPSFADAVAFMVSVSSEREG